MKHLRDYEADDIHELLTTMLNRADEEGEDELADKIGSLLPLLDTEIHDETI